MKTYKPTVYTFGYQQRRPEELFDEAHRLTAEVIDVRLVPRSRAKGWSKTSLTELMRGGYRHIKAFGNVNYKTRGPIELLDAEAGLAAIGEISRFFDLILLCFEADPKDCHRTVVAELIAERYGVEVKHLLRGEL